MIKDLFQIQNYKLFLMNMTLLGMAVAITAPFLVIFMTEHHGMSSSVYGIFMASAAVGSFIVNTVIGRMSDRLTFDRKYLIIAALFMQICAFLSFLLIPNTWILIVSYIIFFSLGAPAMPQLYASARESINQYRSSIAVMANTILRSMFSFGFLFGPLVGSLLLARFDFVGLFCGTVIMFLVVFMASFLIKNSIPPAVSDEIELTSFEEKKVRTY